MQGGHKKGTQKQKKKKQGQSTLLHWWTSATFTSTSTSQGMFTRAISSVDISPSTSGECSCPYRRSFKARFEICKDEDGELSSIRAIRRHSGEDDYPTKTEDLSGRFLTRVQFIFSLDRDRLSQYHLGVQLDLCIFGVLPPIQHWDENARPRVPHAL